MLSVRATTTIMIARHIAGPAYALFVVFAFATLVRIFDSSPPVPSAAAPLTRSRIAIIGGDFDFGPYRLRLPDRVVAAEWSPDDRAFGTHAVLINGAIRWMTKDDEGRLPDDARPMHVVFEARDGVVRPAPAPLHTYGALELLTYERGRAEFHLAGTHDADGVPLRIGCDLDHANAQALERGAFESMTGTLCSLYFSPAHGVQALVQWYPANQLGNAPTLVPTFYADISQRFTPKA
jgi:hypothetical protein